MFKFKFPNFFSKTKKSFFSSREIPFNTKKTSFFRFRRVVLYTTIASSTVILADNYIDNKLELIYSLTKRNKEIISKLEELSNPIYNSTPYLLNPFMEIIYGNLIDKREQVHYNSEVIITPDNENIMLGRFIRLVWNLPIQNQRRSQ